MSATGQQAIRSLSEKMQNVIVTFARTGNPNTAGVKLVRFNPSDPMRTVFGSGSSVSVQQKLNVAGIDFLLANQPAPPPPGSGYLSATCPPAEDRLP